MLSSTQTAAVLAETAVDELHTASTAPAAPVVHRARAINRDNSLSRRVPRLAPEQTAMIDHSTKTTFVPRFIIVIESSFRLCVQTLCWEVFWIIHEVFG